MRFSSANSRMRTPFFAWSLFVFCFSCQTSQANAQEITEMQIPEFLSASAESWISNLSVYCQYEYSSYIEYGDGSDDKVLSRANGFVALRPDFYRLVANWEKDKVSLVAPKQDFDFSATREVQFTFLKAGKVQSGSLTLPKRADQPDWTQRNDKIRFSITKYRPTERRFPISSVPNVFGMCGGWNGSVALGGFETSLDSIKRMEEHFNKHGFDEANGLKVSLAQDNSRYVITQAMKNGDLETSRQIEFRSYRGIPLKTSEVFKGVKVESGSLHRREMHVDEFEFDQDVPLPTLLVTREWHKIYGEGNCFVRRFQIKQGSIRKPIDADFEVLVPRVPERYKYLERPNGTISILDADPEKMQQGAEKEDSSGENGSDEIDSDLVVARPQPFVNLRNAMILVLLISIVCTVVLPCARE